MPYELRPDTAIADMAFKATGKDLKELFQSCAQAVIDGLANTKTIKPAKKITIEKKAKNVDRLLFEFLEEIIFLKDKEGMVFNSVTVEKATEKEVKAILNGDKINPEKQELLNDIKAVTMHYWLIQKKEDGWTADVVLDI